MKNAFPMKLVRDHIPQIITNSGRIPITQIIPQDEFLDHLDRKLVEELGEYQDSHDIMEICDMLEVLYAIVDTLGYSKEETERLRAQKAGRNGGFKERILLREIRGS